jgi:sortase family protein
MPTAPRPARSLSALVLVASLLAVSAPSATLGVERAVDASATPAAASRLATPADGADRAAAARARALTTAPSRPRAVAIPADWTARPKTSVPQPRPTTVSKGTASSGSTRAGSFKGRNHVWIPALGIDRSVAGYACSSSYYPGNRVYRWGCAGRNNVYLFGHAHSVFKPLHDAYVRGRLRKGMKVYYAGGDGKVATYAVSWWRLTTPDDGDWAYAGQSRPSLTLQTCVGARSQYRLIVRLAKT